MFASDNFFHHLLVPPSPEPKPGIFLYLHFVENLMKDLRYASLNFMKTTVVTKKKYHAKQTFLSQVRVHVFCGHTGGPFYTLLDAA